MAFLLLEPWKTLIHLKCGRCQKRSTPWWKSLHLHLSWIDTMCRDFFDRQWMNMINNLPLPDNMKRSPILLSCIFFYFLILHLVLVNSISSLPLSTTFYYRKKCNSAIISKWHQIIVLGGRFSAFLWSRTVSVVYLQSMKRNQNKMRPVWVIKSLLRVY